MIIPTFFEPGETLCWLEGGTLCGAPCAEAFLHRVFLLRHMLYKIVTPEACFRREHVFGMQMQLSISNTNELADVEKVHVRNISMFDK